MRAPFLALLPTLFLSLACTGQAATWTVDTLADELDTPSGTSLSLREALRDAGTGDTIGFAASLDGGTIPLNRGPLGVSKNLTVDAMSLPSGITLDGLKLRGIISASGSATLRGLNIVRGSASNG
jgi:hypothetical protein